MSCTLYCFQCVSCWIAMLDQRGSQGVHCCIKATKIGEWKTVLTTHSACLLHSSGGHLGLKSH